MIDSHGPVSTLQCIHEWSFDLGKKPVFSSKIISGWSAMIFMINKNIFLLNYKIENMLNINL